MSFVCVLSLKCLCLYNSECRVFVSVRNIETSKSSDGSCVDHVSNSTFQVVQNGFRTAANAAKRLKSRLLARSRHLARFMSWH